MRTIKTYFKGAPFYNAFIRSWPPDLPLESCLGDCEEDWWPDRKNLYRTRAPKSGALTRFDVPFELVQDRLPAAALLFHGVHRLRVSAFAGRRHVAPYGYTRGSRNRPERQEGITSTGF